jgi:uncharacterized protein YndB with AHSA1/START domain
MIAGDGATVSVFVAVPPDVAFDVFTRETDLWWRRGPKYRIAGKMRGVLGFEGGVGGRLFEEVELPSGPRVFDVGRITAWEPPERLEFEWRNTNFDATQSTTVEVTFARLRDGTLVTVQHRGWSALPPDHPARHGKVGADFSRMIGLWWGELMSALREHVVNR